MQINLRRFIRYNYLRFKRLQGNPHALALATGLGVFIGLTPTLPLHTVTIFCVTIPLRLSPIAAMIGSTIVSNPLTFVFQYYLAWKIGNCVLPGRITWERVEHTLHAIRSESLGDGIRIWCDISIDGFLVLMIGGLILAIPPAILSYFLSLRFFLKIKEKRRQKHILH
jgi:uncharacterized protein (DUF2062 family)